MFGKTEKKDKQTEEKSVQSEDKSIQNVESTSPTNMSSLDDMDKLFDQFLSNRWMKPFSWQWPEFSEFAKKSELRVPDCDVIEIDNELVVKAELPGIDKKDIDISVTENTITIRGKTNKEEKEEKGDYHRCEISSASFSRMITLPSEVDVEGTKAKMTNGVLEITLPKVETKKRHSVEVE